MPSGTNAGLGTAADMGPRAASQLTCKVTRSLSSGCQFCDRTLEKSCGWIRAPYERVVFVVCWLWV